MRTWLLRIIAHLPLPAIHAIGSVVGWWYFGTGRMARRTHENIAASGIVGDTTELESIARRSMAESGKGALEIIAIWLQPQEKILKWMRACHGWNHVEEAWRDKRGIIFLTPHLGCFEITAQYYAAHRPISVLYRPPRQAWLTPLILSGRARDNIILAPTTLKGVRELVRALKKGDAIGILPDQNPGKNEGEWADFFGRPAYTMTLAHRLAQSTGAKVLMAFGERLPRGRGFIMHIEPLDTDPTPEAINQAIERLILRKPEQYLWSYPRHRKPKGVEPPPVAVPAAAHDLE
jgi:KDO2-lipid IV(A) lauroyltransferase